MSETISWADFEKVVIAVGTVVRAERNEQARKPALKVWVDFGAYGEKKTSAQIAALYTPEEIVGRQVVGVINFPPKQIGPFMSECLVTGFHNERGEVALCVPDQAVPLGTRLL